MTQDAHDVTKREICAKPGPVSGVTPEAVDSKDSVGAPEKICVMSGIREYEDGDPVELWRYGRGGRLAIRASNESGNRSTLVDLWDILEWVSSAGRRIMENNPKVERSPGRGSESGN
jgi:hypothetical protein